MKSFVLAILFAAVDAEEGYTCDGFGLDSPWTNTNLAAAEITTNEECKTACDTAVAAGDTEANDWCCAAATITGEAGS